MAYVQARSGKRALLMSSTAALAVLATPAAAQIAATARPTGGQVSAGQASIGGNATNTVINQSSQNAAINWQTYNIGSGQTVQYVQPNAASMTLNRVLSANPSQIAGHILANGQIVIVNQSGVIFDKGSQVDTGGLVVSSAGISDKNFMSGHLVFDQAGHAGALISNAGNITVRQAGLAALVAPQVANSGVITAKLGRVILGGAVTHTLDLYGDGLVALNVTGQVTQASLGGKQVAALVTNTGTILAPGGTVVLSAAAADGVVTNLVTAGGVVAAPTVGAQTGRVLVQGIGGGITLDGQISATGIAAGTKGGQVVANATGNVTVAAGATVDASGDAGGGVVAIGTTAARAIGGASVHPAMVAQNVSIASGAQLRANATRSGTGGRVAVLSQHKTQAAGDVSAKGGTVAGNGGWIEVSGADVTFGGKLDSGATHGTAGSIFIDPENLDINLTGLGTATDTTYISAAVVDAFTGVVILKADGILTVGAAITPIVGATSATSANSLYLEGDGGIAINANISASHIPVTLYSSGGTINETAGSVISAASLSAFASGAITLSGANVIGAVGNFSQPGANTAVSGLVVSNNAGTLFSGAPTSSDATAVTGISAAASILLDDATSLTIDTGAPVDAGGGNVTIAISGTHGSGANAAPNQLTIQADIIGGDVNLSTSGSVAGYTGSAITEASEVAIDANGTNQGSTSAAGQLVISAATGGISIGGELLSRAPPPPESEIRPIGGTVTLDASAGDITEISTGSILTGTLVGTAGGTGNQGTPPTDNANFVISAGNTISAVNGFSTTGSFSLEDDVGLTVGSLQSGSTIAINGPSATGSTQSGILVLAGAMTASGNIQLSNGLGIAELSTGAVSSTNGQIAMNTGGAIAQQAGGSLAGHEGSGIGTGVTLSTTGSTDFGSYTAAGTFGTAIGTVQGMSLAGTLIAGVLSGGAYTGSAVLTTTGGDIVEGSAGSLRVGTLSGSASGSGTVGITPNGDALFSVSTGNTVGTLGNFTATGSFALEDDTGLSVTGSVSSGSGGVTLQTGGNTTIDGTISAGTVTSGVDTGTLVINTTKGNITEGTSGVLQAATLQGGTTGGTGVIGDALFSPSAGNTIGAIAFFNTAGTFSLEDDAGPTIFQLKVGGDITVSGPGGTVAPSSILVLDGLVQGGGNVTLSNALGIAELTGASVKAVSGGATLQSAGGAVLQQTGATVSGGEATVTGDAVYLAAGGSTNFAADSRTANLGNVAGISFAGGVTAGTLSGGVYSGTASLVATHGDVAEATGATLFAGLVTGQTPTNQTLPDVTNVSLNVSSGNTIGTVSGFAATGNVNLEDDAGLTLGNISAGGSIAVVNNAAQSGILIISGTVQADGSISLPNPLGIAELAGASVTSTNSAVELNSGGAIAQLKTGSIAAGSGSTADNDLTLIAAGSTAFGNYGSQVSAIGTVHGISFGGTLAAGSLVGGTYSGNVSFAANAGDVVEGANGSLRTDILGGNATGSGNQANAPAGNATFDASAGNVVATLSGFSASGNFALEDDSGLTVLGQTAGGSIDIHGPATGAPSGVMIIAGAVSAPGDISLSNALGVAELFGVGITSTGGAVTLTSAGGAVVQEAATANGAPTTISGTSISLVAGGSTNFGLTGIPATVSGVSFGGTLTAGTATGGTYSGSTTLIATHGDVLEGANAVLLTGSLSGTASNGGITATPPLGDATLNVASGNHIGTITGFSATNDFVLEDDTGLTLGNLSAGGSIAVNGPTGGTQSGILVITGKVQADGSITLPNALGIAELTGASVTSTTSAVSLTSSGGAFVQQAGSSVSGGESSATGTGLVITAGGSTDFDTYIPAAALGTVHGISFGGTLAAGTPSGGTYTGFATLTASAGDVVEASTGSLRAGTLSGSATGSGSQTNPPAGNALFDSSAGNVISTLTAFSVNGNFALEDDAGLTVLGQTSGGSIDIFGPSPGTQTGILVIDGAISAPGSISLSNALGIAELSGASITSTLSGVSLVSSGGAIAQQATSQISGGEASGSGTAIAINAGGTTNFDTYLPAAGIGTVHGMSFAGDITAGTLAGATYSGAASLTARAGDIAEASSGALLAGTLSGSATGSGNQANPPAGNLELIADRNNDISDVTSFTTSGDFTLGTSGELQIGNVTAGGSVDIFGPGGTTQNGILVITGAVQANGVVTLVNSLGIAELTGASVTSTLAGVTLTTSGGAFEQQAGATIHGGATSGSGTLLSITAGGNTDYDLYIPASTLGSVSGIAFGGTLASGHSANGSYTGAANLAASGGDIVEGNAGSLRAGTLSGSATGSGNQAVTPAGNALFNVASGNVVGSVTTFSTTGSLALEDDSGLTLVNLTSGAGIDVFGPTGGVSSGILQITGALTASSGDIQLSNSVGIAEFSAASVTSTSGGVSLTSSGGAIVQQAGATLSGGEASATGTAILLTAGGSTDFDNFVPSAGLGTVQGIAFGGQITAGSLTGTVYGGSASLTANAGNIAEQAPGATTPTGVVQAGLLSLAAASGGSSAAGNIALTTTSSATAGNQIAGLGTASADAGFDFVDGQAVTITGAVQAGLAATTSQNLAIVAPGIFVTTGSLQLLPPNGTNPGVLSLVADQFSFATAGDVSTPGGLVALDLLNANPANTVFSVGNLSTDTVSPISLQHITTQSGTLAIGSLDGTNASPQNTGTGSWTIGAGGTVTAIDFSQPVDLAGGNTAAALGLFSNDSINVSGGITVTSLYGSAGGTLAASGTASILGNNSIGTLGVIDAAGTLLGFTTAQAGTLGTAPQFRFADTSPLLVIGPVSAGQGAVQIAVTGTQGNAPNALTIGGTITNGEDFATGGQISGTDISLSAAGSISQLTGTINAFGATASAPTNGTIVFAAQNGGIALDGTVAGGVFTGNAFSPNAQSALLLSAGGGDITEGTAATLSAGTLAALTSGNILLGGAANTFKVVGSLTADGLTLYGLTASGATGILLQNTGSLVIADDTGSPAHATVSAIGPDNSGGGTGSIVLSLATGSLTLGTTNGTTVEALGGVTLTAPGAITQNGGLVDSTQNSVSVTSTTASVSQIGGAFTAGGGNVEISAATGISQSGGSIIASQNAGLTTAAGSITQLNSSIGAGGDVTITAPGATAGLGFGQTGSSIDAGGNADITSSAGSFTQVSSTILGTHGVTLDVFGAVSSTGLGTIASSGIAGDATSGTVVIASANGSIGFDGLIAGGGVTGQNFAPASSSAVLLSAKGGSITEANSGSIDTGTLAASAAGNLSLASTTNQISAIGPLSATQPNLTLNGLFAGGTSGIALTDAASLTILPDSSTTNPVIQAGATGATLTIDEIGADVLNAHTTYGSLLIGLAGASTLEAYGDVTLSSTGTISQGLGSVTSGHGALNVSSTDGDVAQSGATFSAAAGTIAVTAGGNISQSAATIDAGGNIGITAGGSITQTLVSEIKSAGGNVTLTAGSNAGAGALALPGGNISQDDSRIDAAGSVTGVASATTENAGLGNITQSNGSTIAAGTDASLSSAQGSFTQTSSSVLGTHGVSLAFEGAVDSVLGTIASAGIAHDATSGTVAISSGAGIGFTGLIAAGPAGAVLLSSAGDISEANTGGTLTGIITAPVLSASAAGSIALGGANQVSGIAAIGALKGLTAANGDTDFNDLTALAVSSGATIGAPSGAITLSVGTLTADSLSLTGATVSANGDITLSSTGDFAQTGGLIQSSQGSVALSGNNFNQTGGGVINAATDASISAQGSASFTGSTLEATDNVTILSGLATHPTAGSVFQQTGTGNAPDVISAGSTVTIQPAAGGAFNIVQSAGNTIVAGQAVILDAPLGLSLAGTVQSGILTSGVYTGSLALDAGAAGIQAPTATLVVGTLAASSGGAMTLDGTANQISTIGTVGMLVGLTAAGALTLSDIVSLNVAANVTGSNAVTFDIDPGNFTVQPGIKISAIDALDITATGTVLTSGTLTGGSVDITAGGAFTESTNSLIFGTSSATISSGAAITIDGLVKSLGLVTLSGTDIDIGPGGSISGSTTGTLAAPGNITIDGTTNFSGSLTVKAGGSFTEGSSGIITAGPTSITATAGAATFDGALTVTGPLSVSAGTNIDMATGAILSATGAGTFVAPGTITADGSLTIGGSLSLAAGQNFVEDAPGIIHAGPTTITATTGSATIDGILISTGALGITAGTDITQAQFGTIASGTGGNTDLTAGTGAVTLGGVLTSGGALTIGAGTDVTLAQTSTVNAGATSITATAGTATFAGILTTTDSLTVLAGADIAEAAGASITVQTGSISLAAGGAVSIDGLLTGSDPLTITAQTDFTEAQTGTIQAGATSVTATTGAVTLNGLLTANGSLAASAGTDFTLAQTSTVTAGATTLAANGGTATIAGALTANGALAITASADVTEAPGATITGTSSGSIVAGGAVTIDSLLSLGGPLTVAAQTDFTEAQTGTILAGATSITATTGALSLSGLLTANGALTASAGADLTLAQTSAVTAGATTLAANGGTATIAGALTANGALAITASADVLESPNATITGTSSGTIVAGGAVSIDSLLSLGGPLTIAAQTDFTEAQAGTIQAGATSLTATTGAVTLNGLLTANGTLTASAGTDLTLAQTSVVTAGATTLAANGGTATIAGALTANGDLAITASADVIEAPSATITGTSSGSIAAGGAVAIDSLLSLGGPLTVVAQTDFTEAQTGTIQTGTIQAGTTSITATTGMLSLSGLLTANGALTASAGTDFTLASTSTVTADATTIAAKAGTASIAGTLTANGALAITAGSDVTLAAGAAVTGASSGSITAGGATTIDGALSLAGSLTIFATTDYSQAGTITSGTGISFPVSITASTGSMNIDGILAATGPVDLTAGQAFAEGPAGAISGAGVNVTASHGAVTVDGAILSSLGFIIAAGTDFTEAAGATIQGELPSATPAGAVATGSHASPAVIFGQITAGGTITIDGSVIDPAALTFGAGASFAEGSTGLIKGGITDVSAKAGAAAIDGPLTALTSLVITAGTDILINTDLSVGGPTQLDGGGNVSIDGSFTSSGNLTIAAGQSFAEGAVNGATRITAGATSITATNGAATIDGMLDVTGPLTLYAGTDVSLAQAREITAGITSITANTGSATIDGSLTANGQLTISAGTGFAEGQGGFIGGGPIGITAVNGAATVDGALNAYGALTIKAGSSFAEGATGIITGGPINVSATTGGASIDGLFTSTGAFSVLAGTDINQGADSSMVANVTGAPAISSLLTAPGTITLGGAISAPSLVIGESTTKSIIWNGNSIKTGSNAGIHGATSSISIAEPLKAGDGALGVYTDSTSFLQTGTSTVDPLAGKSATFQVTIEGRGSAKFNDLLAPSSQLLLVLEHGGTANGQIDVAGLNVFYTQGTTPIAPVKLTGFVGARGGFAAAAVGFSHHLPDVNYQVNGCPIQSINCVLLSPLIVPIVDPVNDYAEGTQRKRHSDDDALPNVGEEDY